MDKYVGAASILVKGSLLAEAQRVRVSIRSNANPVRTMKKGLAGRSRGPVTSEITVENAVPRAGMEQDFVTMLLVDQDVDLQFVFDGRTYTYEGWIDSVDKESAVDAAAGVNFTVMAGPPVIS